MLVFSDQDLIVSDLLSEGLDTELVSLVSNLLAQDNYKLIEISDASEELLYTNMNDFMKKIVDDLNELSTSNSALSDGSLKINHNHNGACHS